MAELGRLLRTLRHLDPAQVWHRARLRARRALQERSAPRVRARYRRLAAALPLPDFADPGLARVAQLRAERAPVEARVAAARSVLAGRFCFLNVTRELGPEPDWYAPELDVGTRLWKTWLHEFPFALDLAVAARATGEPAFRERFLALVESWQAASPLARPGFALDAWNARAVATRLVNWALAASVLGLRRESPEGERLGRALALHACFLRDHLELDLRGNHLWRDAVGLVHARHLLGEPADALGLLRQQIEAQLLDDGAHEERVPHYHALALQDLVELRALLGAETPPWLDDAVARMAGFLAYLLPADGRLPLFGDTWHDELDPRRLLAEAGEARPPALALAARASGLAVLRRGDAQLVARVGLHGPDHQLGHAHADGLSFELWHGAARIVTDTGTGTYDPGAERARLRATAAHNTIQLDDAEQLEAWGSFRVGRRGRGRVLGFGEGVGHAWLAASHDGFRHLPGRPLHQRLFVLGADGALVLDVVAGRGRHRIRTALHRHPDAAPDGYALVPLVGRARTLEVPLHERFNHTREMTEVYVEADAELPWIGGWAVHFGKVREGLAAQLHLEEGAIVARAAGLGGGLEVRWNPAAAGPASASLALWSGPPGSAT